MSTLVLTRLPARTASPAAGPGLLARILEHLIECRARQADRHLGLLLNPTHSKTRSPT